MSRAEETAIIFYLGGVASQLARSFNPLRPNVAFYRYPGPAGNPALISGK
ncbi:hypothetical protein ACPOL_6857 (plasmid) [Acidisarcina polymorpha]|uniref:Uncharacterized protein n=1 Tax=Acidisarcina polymorpha TaxID=2211140 RepID=A0A2Z5GBT6_9BACT|nr:hypothetical protein ACPOL_6857 [Acidisarcina polymorpha]